MRLGGALIGERAALLGRLHLGVVTVAVLLATWPVAASGSTVSMTGGVLSYVAAGGEANQLTISTVLGDYDLVDEGAVIVAPPCTPVDPAGHEVICPAAGVGALNIDLGDLDDELSMADSPYPPAPTPGTFLVTAEGGPGNDALGGTAGADLLDGGPGDDRLVNGGPGADHVSGGDGNDLVNGADGADTVDGDAGADDIVGGPGDDLVRGGPGADSVDVDTAFDPDEVLGRDVLEGGAGDDRFGAGAAGSAEPDVLSGGDGEDTVSYGVRSAPVTVTLDAVANDGEPGEADNVLPDVERVIGGSDSDALVGSDAANVLDGGPGDDLISGLGGDDTLRGGVNDSGSDKLVGGAGRDVLSGGAGDDELDGGDGDDALFGAGGTDSLAGEGGQDTLEGGTGLDSLDGGAGDDTLNGGGVGLIGADGADELNGGAGDDALLGGPGNDRLDGGPGADRISGEDGRDTVTYEDRGSPISVTFDGVANDGERGENDNVASDVEIVLGGAVADTLVGNAQTNVLDAGSGDDYVNAGRGRDSLEGGTGIDVLRARDGSRDLVSCGEGVDLAIVDRRDTVRDCNYVDRGRRRAPPLGRAARVEPVSGTVRLRLPGASRSVPLHEAVEVPIGSTLDARRGTVSVVTTKRRGGTVQEGRFRGGAFTVLQRRVARPVTQLRLTGGRFRACRRSGVGRASVRVRLRARIATKRRGKTQVRGRYSVGGSYGTTWLTEDRCDGTLTRVLTGTVRVRDLRRHRTVVVRAGHRYLARAR